MEEWGDQTLTAVTFPTFLTGHEPSPSEFQVLLPLSASKPANQTITSTTTLTNDNDLFVAVQSGATYQFEVSLGVMGAGSATVGDINLRWTFPGGTLTTHAVGLTSAVAYGVSTTGSVNSVRFRDTTSPSTTIPFGTPSTNFAVVTINMIYACTADGTLQLQWAQRVSSGTATAVGAGSYMVGSRIA